MESIRDGYKSLPICDEPSLFSTLEKDAPTGVRPLVI